MKIADLIDAYEGAAKLRGLAPTQLNALKVVRRFFGVMVADRLSPSITELYVNGRRKGNWSNVHGTRRAADGTIRRELGALSAVLNWAHQRKLIKDAPPVIDLPPPSPARAVFMDLATADLVFDTAAIDAENGDRTALFVCLALDTWARADAIETLPWDRTTFTPGLIDYRDPARPETVKRRVPVPMSTRLRAVLEAVRPSGERWHEPVCGRITQYAWQKYKKRCGIPSVITRHDLRRTGISLALARGVEPLKVAQMAGDNLETIMKHYAHFMPDYLDGVVS